MPGFVIVGLSPKWKMCQGCTYFFRGWGPLDMWPVGMVHSRDGQKWGLCLIFREAKKGFYAKIGLSCCEPQSRAVNCAKGRYYSERNKAQNTNATPKPLTLKCGFQRLIFPFSARRNSLLFVNSSGTWDS